MLRRFRGEPVPSERRGASADELTPTRSAGSDVPGTGALDVPELNTGASLKYHRPPLGTGYTTPPQSVGMGSEVKQAGAGRAFIPPAMAFPVQSPTPIPDGRRIARPMPSGAWDEADVIRPPGGVAGG